MAQKLKFGNGVWANKEGSTLAYNDENGNYKPLPFNFTRSSSATRVNKQGLIEVVKNNKPRIDYLDSAKGVLLLEPSRTNSITSSQDIGTGWTYTNVGAALNQTTSPDGDITADSIVPDATSGQHSINSVNITSSGSFTLSAFVKAGELTKVAIRESANTGSYASFDLSSGIKIEDNVSGASFIQSYGNGWYRIGVTGTFSGNIRLGINVLSNSYTTGNPSSGTTFFSGNSSNKLFCWGMQCELGTTYATSYIPTQGAAVTRVAETASGSGNSEVFNDSEGVLYFEGNSLANDGTFKFISLSDNSLNNVVWIYYRSEANQINFRVLVGGVTSFDQIYTINDATRNAKLALKYKENDFSAWVNGFKVFTDTSGSIFPIGTLKNLEFNRPDDTNFFYGKTKELGYYDILTDTELEYLTSYRSWESMVNELNLNIIYNG